MYTRSFYQESTDMKIPENYDGNALAEERALPRESAPPRPSVAEPKVSPREDREPESEDGCEPAVAESRGGIFERLTSRSLKGGGVWESLKGLIGTHAFSHPPKIGSEEILILAISAFLFFSRDGDRECALILLALLFV